MEEPLFAQVFFFSEVGKLSSVVLFFWLLGGRGTGNGSNLRFFFCDNFGGNFMECCSGKEQRDDIEPIFSNLLRYSWDFSVISVELESVWVQLWEKLFLDPDFWQKNYQLSRKFQVFHWKQHSTGSWSPWRVYSTIIPPLGNRPCKTGNPIRAQHNGTTGWKNVQHQRRHTVHHFYDTNMRCAMTNRQPHPRTGLLVAILSGHVPEMLHPPQTRVGFSYLSHIRAWTLHRMWPLVLAVASSLFSSL